MRPWLLASFGRAVLAQTPGRCRAVLCPSGPALAGDHRRPHSSSRGPSVHPGLPRKLSQSGVEENGGSSVAPTSEPQDVSARKHLYGRELILSSVDPSRVCYLKRCLGWAVGKEQACAPSSRPGPALLPKLSVLSHCGLQAEVKVHIAGVFRTRLKGSLKIPDFSFFFQILSGTCDLLGFCSQGLR